MAIRSLEAATAPQASSRATQDLCVLDALVVDQGLPEASDLGIAHTADHHGVHRPEGQGPAHEVGAGVAVADHGDVLSDMPEDPEVASVAAQGAEDRRIAPGGGPPSAAAAEREERSGVGLGVLLPILEAGESTV
jgi:hypothetical protein